MPDNERPVRRYRFGVFEVDFRLGQLRKGGLRLRLAGQPLQILERLLERAGDVVTREELRSELWPADTFVDFEHNLNSAVKRLRTALGDAADAPRFIETLPRRGYRFLAPVEIVPDAGPAESSADESDVDVTVLPDAGSRPPASAVPAPVAAVAGVSFGSVRRLAAGVALGALLIVVAWLVAGAGAREEMPPAAGASIAVLPFENLSGDESQSYLADGTTEALIAGLAQVKSIKVISRTSVMRFQGARRPVLEIARELGVGTVLEGSVTRQGDQLRITAQLIDARTDRHLWAETYNGRIRDLLTFQSRVAQAVAREVHATLSPPEEARLARVPPVDAAVQEAYLKARYFWNQRTAEGLSRAIEYFEQARSLDPDYAPARAGLADAYNLVPRYGNQPTREALLLAKEHALAALAIDPDSADAYAALAKVQHSLDWDWEGAERSFQRAIQLSPGYATAYHWYSIFLLTIGRVEEGIAEARRARELDPLSPVINLHLAYSLYLGDRLDEAEASVRRALELAPRYANAHYLLGWIRLRQGNHEAARREVSMATDLATDDREYLPGLIAVDVATGRMAGARRTLADIRATHTSAEDSGQPLFWALVALGETDEAFRILEGDFENRSVCFYLFHLTNHWFLAPLREDPRLHVLFKTAGLSVLEQAGPAPTSRPTRGE